MFKLNWQLSRFKSLAINLALLLAIYFVSRILFYIFNASTFEKFTISEILNTFLVGFRFDLSALAFLNIVYILLLLLPFDFVFSRSYQRFLHVVFLLLNFPILVFHICDIEYYKFTGARITMALTAQGGELMNQLDQFIVNYWYIVGFCLIALFILIWFYQPLKLRLGNGTSGDGSVSQNNGIDSNSPYHSGRPLQYLVVSFFCILAVAFFARGGLQKKVLTPSYAFTVARDELAILALNSSFTIIKTHSKDHLRDVNYYPSLADAKAVLLKPQFNFKGYPKQNVVILILESFATEFWGVANGGEGYTPFLDTLAQKGLFFRNNFANGRKSIEAVPSILLGLPSLMDHPLAKSRFQFNDWHGLGKILHDQGYSSAFFHGAETGSMHFDAVAKLSGFDEYFGLEKYPNPEDTDGHWGIFDEPYLQYVNQQLSNLPQPFLAVAFTLSSHQPYPMPTKYAGQFKKGPTPLHESIGYVDYALKLFFEAAEKEPWFKNTLFVITGDHTQMSPSVNYSTELGRYMVPLLLYHPGVQLRADTSRITQHADILPTILDFLAVKDAAVPLFGRSVFESETQNTTSQSGGRALFYANGRYYLVTQGQAMTFDSNKNTFGVLKFGHESANSNKPSDDPNAANAGDPNTAVARETTPQDLPLQNELKAFIQYFNNGLNSNQLY